MNTLSFLDEKIDYSGKTLLLDHYCGVGDFLWRTCLHREIKRRFPNLKLVVSSMGNYWKLMLQNNPHIDELRDKIGSNIDLTGIDFHISDQKCPHVISSYARELDALDALEIWSGLKIRDKSYVYSVTKEESDWADTFLNKFKRPIVGIQLKSSTWVRTPVPEEMLRLIKMLRFNNIQVIVMDNGGFGFVDEGITNMAQNYNIREIAAVIQKTDLMICPDSGLLHFAGHFKIPTIGIFGGSDPSCRLKYLSTVIPILSNPKLNCQFCWQHSYACQFGIPAPCLVNIKAENIFDIVKELI